MRHRLFLATAFAMTALPLAAQAQGCNPGTVNLRVLDCNGGPVTSCKVSVLRRFPQCLVKEPLLTDLELGHRDFLVDVTTIHDLPPGEFVIQVDAEMHAMTRSEPFTITKEAMTADVTVSLTRGTTITGTVYGADGRPLAGATVATLEPLEMALSWRWGIRPTNWPVTITLTNTVTDKDGHFRLANIAKGTYRIATTHSGHCSSTRTAKVSDQRSLALGDVGLLRGTELSGTCLFGAKPESGLNVWVVKQGEPAAAWSTKTDAHGRWRLGVCLPPGHYAVHASQDGLSDNPLEWLRQTTFSEQKVTIGANPTRVEKSLVIPKN